MVNDLAIRLDQHVRSAGHAITGVSIGAVGDRATWKVFPSSLQGAAQAAINAFVIPTEQQLADEAVDREIDAKVLKAIVMEIHAILPTPKPTLVQLRNNIIARYKSL